MMVGSSSFKTVFDSNKNFKKTKKKNKTVSENEKLRVLILN